MYINKKKTCKILACAMSALFIGTINGVASAEEEPQSDNEVTVTEDSITVNGKTTKYNSITGNIVAGRTGYEYIGSGTRGIIGNEFFTGGISATGDVYGNTMTVRNANLNGWEIIVAGSTLGNVFNNVSNFYDVTNVAFIDGGFAYNGNGNVYNNILNFYSGTVGGLHGGHSNNGDAYDNTVNIYGGTVGEAGGGYSNFGNTKYNKLNIFNGVINGNAYGGIAIYSGTSGEAKENVVNVRGGTINGNIYGGSSASGNVTGNAINIYGGEINGKVYSGESTSGTITENTINIYGNPNLVNAEFYAGTGGGTIGSNDLSIFTKNITVQTINGFENLNFHLPSNLVNGDTILTINNPSGTISNNINVYSNGNLNLTTGDTFTLMTTPSASGLTLGNYTSDGILSRGISLDYALSFSPITSGGVTTGFGATVGNIIGGGLKEQASLLTSAVVDTASSLDSGTDRLLEWLPVEGVADINSMPVTYFDPFMGIGGSSLSIDTGNGSKLKTKNGGINFGLSSNLKNSHGMLIIAPVVDYGQDVYESTLSDANRTTGSGHTKYFTGGFIARQVSTHGMYYETSFRYGKVRTNFTSNNFLVHGLPTTASYSASTPCYSGHVRIGWRDHISPQNVLDVYGIYSLNRVKGFNTTVSTGEDYSFSAVKSGRIRIGARLTREVKEKHNFYSEIAYIHEFTGETVGEYMGMTTRKDGLKGNTGLIELGWQMRPSKNSPTFLDTAVTCWLGSQKGVTFTAKFKRDF